VRSSRARRGTQHRAGVGLGSNAVRPKEGDDGWGPPVSCSTRGTRGARLLGHVGSERSGGLRLRLGYKLGLAGLGKEQG
jgi:hypothetical protein